MLFFSIYRFEKLVYNNCVHIDKLGEIKAVAFDIDGTLYRTWKLNIRIVFHFLRYNQFFLKYGLVRAKIRKIPLNDSFKNVQTKMMAEKLHCSPSEAELLLTRIVYAGLSSYFYKIKPYKGAVELIKDLKNAGFKIALLSDFPPEQKGDIWGVKELCDVVLGTEETGALKPSAEPFKKMAELLNLPAEEILYVGNSHKYDVVGSKNAGMKAAWLVQPEKGIIGIKSKIADITFWKYSQLRQILLGNKETKK